MSLGTELYNVLNSMLPHAMCKQNVHVMLICGLNGFLFQ